MYLNNDGHSKVKGKTVEQMAFERKQKQNEFEPDFVKKGKNKLEAKQNWSKQQSWLRKINEGQSKDPNLKEMQKIDKIL